MKNLNIYAFADEASNSLDGQITALKRNGLSGIEIRNVDGEGIADISCSKAKEIRKKLDDAGLITWSVGSPIGKIDIEKDDFGKEIERLKHIIEIAHILDTLNIRLFSFYIPTGKSADDYEAEVLDRMGKIAEITAKEGVYACHENEKGIYGDTAERCLKLYENIPLLRGIFDPANFVQCGVDTAKAWKMLNPYIYYMHIKDALADGSVVPAGKGIGNIKNIVDDFRANRGDAVTLEPHLMNFVSLASLEREGEESKVGGMLFANDDAAFDAACEAFKGLL